MIVILSLFLLACTDGEKRLVVNSAVDEDLARDTVKVLDILDEKISGNKKAEFKDEDAELLEEYITVYAPKKGYKESPELYEEVSRPFTTDDYQIYFRTETLVFSFGPNALVDEDGNYINGTSNFSWQKEDILDLIENGFVPKD